MGIPDGAHTHGHGSGSGGAGTVLLVILAAALAGPAVAAALAAIVHALIIAAAVIGGLAAVGLVAAVAWRLRRAGPEPPRVILRATPVPPRRSVPLPEPPRTLGPAREVHLHLHGVTAEDVAAILQRDGGSARPSTDQE